MSEFMIRMPKLKSKRQIIFLFYICQLFVIQYLKIKWGYCYRSIMKKDTVKNILVIFCLNRKSTFIK